LIEVCGRPVPATNTDDGIRAVRGRNPIDPEGVRHYLSDKLGDDLKAVRSAMQKLAKAYRPQELAHDAYRLYERFRPDIPGGQEGLGSERRPRPGADRAAGEGETVTRSSNLLADLPRQMPDELITTVLDAADVRIERIVSHGHASPGGFWYDQDQHEWVVVLTGAARLRFEDETVEMRPGDFVNIPAHRMHRVEWTAPDEPTVWLAVLYRT
jgi:cupin 2 domain-containing protein